MYPGFGSWLQKGTSFHAANKPLDMPGMDAANPHSYHAKANFMYQFVARYGNKNVPIACFSSDRSKKGVWFGIY